MESPQSTLTDTPTFPTPPSPTSTLAASPFSMIELEPAGARGGSPVPMAARPVRQNAGAGPVRPSALRAITPLRARTEDMTRLLLNIKTAQRCSDDAERLSCMEHAKFIIDEILEANPRADTTALKDLYDLLVDVEHAFHDFAEGECTHTESLNAQRQSLDEARTLFRDIRRTTVQH
jgi:hypothetical protein